jgi:methylenetetrahydrofolate dehydrogenase (NADP+)/methenyltetrahydrofolate cyclohydrolase
MALILDGILKSAEIKAEIKQEVLALTAKGLRPPHLAAILVGNDGASQTYVNSKIRDCEEVGFRSTLVRMDEHTSEAELLRQVEFFNNDPALDGFIVQLPLPAHIDEQRVIMAVSPLKDVDGFHPVNVGRMVLGLEGFVPATPSGIIELIRRYNVDTEGKHCVVVGRSAIVGTPMNILMSRSTWPGNSTVTLAHSRTRDIQHHTLQADILISATGQSESIGMDMIKPGAIVIDVGITRVPDESRKKGYRIAGDIRFDEVVDHVSAITPVPGGVGPMTRASLLINTMKAYKMRQSRES